MAPQKRTMEQKRWIKVGKVALVKSHPNSSRSVRLVSQTPTTTVNTAKRFNVILPKTLKPSNSYLHVMQAPIQLNIQKDVVTSQEMNDELKSLMDKFDKKARVVDHLLKEQQQILSQINSYWENYLENNELHA